MHHLGHMLQLDSVRPRQVRDRPAYLQDAGIRSRGYLQLIEPAEQETIFRDRYGTQFEPNSGGFRSNSPITRFDKLRN